MAERLGERAPRAPRAPSGDHRAHALLVEAGRWRGRSLWQASRARLRRDRTAMWSLRFLVFFSLVSLLAPLLPLPSPIAMDLRLEPSQPVWPWEAWGDEGFLPQYWELGALDQTLVTWRQELFGTWQTGAWLGTDAKGRDLLSRILWGSRTSLLVALAATLTSLLIGVTYGATAGLAGGRTDARMMRLVDVLYSVPFIFVVIFLLALLNTPRSDLSAEPLVDRQKVFYLVIGAIYWLTMARVVRGQVLSMRHAGFIEAARAMGASLPRILATHVLPNVLGVAIVYLTLTIPAVMLFEAFLSFLGLGIEPPRVSWGLLAADGTEAIGPLRVYWWLVVWPAVFMAATLLSLNLLGDGLRDALDPRAQRRG